MTKREFNKQLNACRTKDKKLVDLEKLAALPEDTKTSMALFIIGYRQPVLRELVTSIDPHWLASMGYMYQTTGKKSGFTFIHTCEHRIV